MGRLIGSVVLGYIVMAAVVFAGLTLAYLAMGTDRAFRPGVYDVSTLWIMVSFVVGFGAALIGGWVASGVARDANAARLLALFVVILGLGMVVTVLLGGSQPIVPRTAVVSAMDAMQQARTPLWIMLLNPLVGAFGVLVGGRALGPAVPSVRRGDSKTSPV